MRVIALALLWLGVSAEAATLRLKAFDAEGKPLDGPALMAHIAPAAKKAAGVVQPLGVHVTDLDDNPVAGRPWLTPEATLRWEGATRIKASLPWPVAHDGFSTVALDKDGAGYSDGDNILLNEEIALTQFRLFQEAWKERTSAWEPVYKPSRRALGLRQEAVEAIAAARAVSEPGPRAALFEKALTRISLAWAKALFEHGSQAAEHPKLGAALRWGLTLDETMASRVSEHEWIAKQVASSGANWVRLVFHLNAEDFLYAKQRSFNEYDAIVNELHRNKLHIMGSVLDSTQWPRGMEPRALAHRTRNLVMQYKPLIRSWEVASEPNGDWLGGYKSPLPRDTVTRAVREAAAEVKRIDPSLETVATLYWWEGTAPDDAHPTFAWLKKALPTGAFSQIDLVGLSVYPDEHPMGLAFDPVFGKLRRYFPDKRLMLGAFGYVEGEKLEGYWWLDPSDVDGARKDLVILYSGAAASAARSVGGGFWWPTLTTMLKVRRDEDSLFKIYKRTLQKLGR